MAALIPQPCRHWHRYYGVMAPMATLRAAVTALELAKDEVPEPTAMAAAVPATKPGATFQKRDSRPSGRADLGPGMAQVRDPPLWQLPVAAQYMRKTNP